MFRYFVLLVALGAAIAEDDCTGYDLPKTDGESPMGVPVLITGVGGFMASHLARWCVDLGYTVTGVDDMSGGFQSNIPKGIKFVQGDLKDAKFVETLFTTQGPFKYVFHLAAYAAEGMSHFIRGFNYQNNLVASVYLLNWAVKTRVECFVFTSSIAVYGTGQLPLKEETVPRPEDPYGIGKYAFELDLQAAHEMFGLDYVIFRPHNVYGPNQNIWDRYRNVIGIFMNQILSGRNMTIFGDGAQTRAFSYVDDVVHPIALAPLFKEAHNQVFNVGADTPHTVGHLARVVGKAMGLANPEAAIDHLDARHEVVHASSDHRKVRCFFPKLPPPIDLTTGIKKTVEWVQAIGKDLKPVEFDAVEVTRNMPPSWLNAPLKQQAADEQALASRSRRKPEL